jgi:hypothetical protein
MLFGYWSSDMAQTLQLSEAAYREVQSYATEVGRDPEQMAEEVMLAGLHTLRRLHYFESKPKNVDVSDALEILSRAGKGNPPDPWDELPEDLKR